MNDDFSVTIAAQRDALHGDLALSAGIIAAFSLSRNATINAPEDFNPLCPPLTLRIDGSGSTHGVEMHDVTINVFAGRLSDAGVEQTKTLASSCPHQACAKSPDAGWFNPGFLAALMVLFLRGWLRARKAKQGAAK